MKTFPDIDDYFIKIPWRYVTYIFRKFPYVKNRINPNGTKIFKKRIIFLRC